MPAKTMQVREKSTPAAAQTTEDGSLSAYGRAQIDRRQERRSTPTNCARPMPIGGPAITSPGDDLSAGQSPAERASQAGAHQEPPARTLGSQSRARLYYIHLNRLIKKYDLDMIFMAGPGHGAPGVLGPVYLEGTYSEIYPTRARTKKDCALLQAVLVSGRHRQPLHARNSGLDS